MVHHHCYQFNSVESNDLILTLLLGLLRSHFVCFVQNICKWLINFMKLLLPIWFLIHVCCYLLWFFDLRIILFNIFIFCSGILLFYFSFDILFVFWNSTWSFLIRFDLIISFNNSFISFIFLLFWLGWNFFISRMINFDISLVIFVLLPGFLWLFCSLFWFNLFIMFRIVFWTVFICSSGTVCSRHIVFNLSWTFIIVLLL